APSPALGLRPPPEWISPVKTLGLDRSLARPLAAVASLLGTSLVFLTIVLVQQASAATVTACVAKKGTVKILKGRSKCRHGETKVSWMIATPGAAGPQGPAGAK